MHRIKKITVTVLLAALVAVIYFLYPSVMNYGKLDLIPVFSADPISFTQNEELHLYPEGLIVCGSPSRFYSWDGIDILPPFKQDDLLFEGGSIDITAHTENHIATAKGRIYNTKTVPFTLVYENQEINLWDMKEYADFLLLLILNDESVAEPYILVNNSDFLISLDGMGDSKYISAAGLETAKDLSLLTISLDSPVPLSRVFHYANRNELYGVLSLEDKFIYNIFRLKSNVILIGINNILCYNIDGTIQWSLDIKSNGLFEVIPSDSGLLLYFPQLAKLDKEKGNALRIRSNGNYSVEQFPKYLSDLESYHNGYIGLEYRNTLVFMNKYGKAIKKQRLQEPIDLLLVHPYQPDSIYVRERGGNLQMYTTEKQEEN